MKTSVRKNRIGGKYSIVGIGEAGVGKADPGQTSLSLQARAAQRAMLDCGLQPSAIDAVFAQWDDRIASLLVSEYLGIQPRYTDSTLVGGQSNLTHIVHAISAIETGLCETALITYGSTQRSDKSRRLSGLNLDPRTPNGQFVQPYGIVSPIGFYAMQAKLHQCRYGSTAEDLGEIALAARKWAQLNPNAVDQDDLTMEQYLASPMICDPLRKLDICKVTDGAGAIIVTSSERARDLNQVPVQVLGFGEKYRHHLTPFNNDDWLDNGFVADITNEALHMAQRERDDIDVVQIYDAFSVSTLIGLEDLGFCRRGEAGEIIHGGRIAPGGDFPLNTSGGGLSFNHPGMFGMQLAIESIRQLRGECGARQVSDAKTCILLSGGIVMSAHNVTVLGRE